MHLELVDAVNVAFHRIFNGADVDLLVVQFAQGRVKGGVFAEPSGRDKHDADRMADDLLKRVRFSTETKRFQIRQHLAKINYADDVFFAVSTGQ